MIYALRGPLAAYVRRFAAREYGDSHEAIKRRDGPLNGLYGGFAFWGLLCHAGHGRKNSRLEAIGGHASGEKLPGNTGIPARIMDGSRSAGRLAARATLTAKEIPPQETPGRAVVVSRFFRCLPDDHQGKGKDK